MDSHRPRPTLQRKRAWISERSLVRAIRIVYSAATRVLFLRFRNLSIVSTSPYIRIPVRRWSPPLYSDGSMGSKKCAQDIARAPPFRIPHSYGKAVYFGRPFISSTGARWITPPGEGLRKAAHAGWNPSVGQGRCAAHQLR